MQGRGKKATAAASAVPKVGKRVSEVLEFAKIASVNERGFVTFPALYSIDAHGKHHKWQIFCTIAEPFSADLSDTNGVWLKRLVFIPSYDFTDRRELPSGYAGVYWTVTGQIDTTKPKTSLPKFVTEGKGSGATLSTPYTQALSDVRTEYNKRVKKGSATSIEGLTDTSAKITFDSLLNNESRGATPESRIRVFPMALHDVNARVDDRHAEQIADRGGQWKHVVLPVMMQPKLDGVRLIVVADPALPSGIDFYSRRREQYASQKWLTDLMKNVLLGKYPRLYLDGELYEHGKPLQELSGSSRRIDDDADNRLEYHIFDCFYIDRADMPFSDRYALLSEVISDIYRAGEALAKKHILLVPAVQCNTLACIDRTYEGFIAQKYEGAILRNITSKYEFGINSEKRSHTTLKIKPRSDGEWKLNGFTTGKKGKDAEAIIWICETDDGKTFNVTPNWKTEFRKKIRNHFIEYSDYFNAELYGHLVVIEYSDLSKDGIPQQPKMIRFYDPADDEKLSKLIAS